ARAPLHERRLTIDGFEREDGLYDIEGRIVDTKTYAYDSDWHGRVEPGTPVHDMSIRLTIDDRMKVHGIATVSDRSPFAPCHEAAVNYEALVGLTIGPGWIRALRQRVGGTAGCTHITELLSQVATVAFQTMVKKRQEQAHKRTVDGVSDRPRARPMMIGACHAFAVDGPVVKRYWPEYHKSAEPQDASDDEQAAE
ncbi:MAG: DUF2889 domain-containing protein, partial [Alphaproteobacteria bacterium]|nr:DUF2889 domain-containing protein [Alphaproteobacteria bacterium]